MGTLTHSWCGAGGASGDLCLETLKPFPLYKHTTMWTLPPRSPHITVGLHASFYDIFAPSPL